MARGKYFDVKKTLKRDKLINLIVGGRGIGKTYSTLQFGVDNYIDTGETFIYLRRYKSELKEFKTIFNKHFKNGNIDSERFYIDKTGRELLDKENKDCVVCKAIELSKAVAKKSAVFDTCTLVVFDEFILEKSSMHYIEDEFSLFHGFVETIARMDELETGRIVKCLLLANAVSRNNPYFMGYNIPIIKNDLYINDDLLVYFPNNEEFKKQKETTRWGKFLSKHTKLNDYMINNKFNDKNNFICKLPQKTQYIATLKYLKTKIGVYMDLDTTRFYISEKYNDNNTLAYALTLQDNTPNYVLFKRGVRLFDMLVDYWNIGYIRFTSIKIQTIFVDILKILK